MADRDVAQARREAGGRGILDLKFRRVLTRHGLVEQCECKGRCPHGFLAIHCGECDLDYCTTCHGLGIKEKK